MVADWLAKAGQTMFHSKISWETSPPQEFRDIMLRIELDGLLWEETSNYFTFYLCKKRKNRRIYNYTSLQAKFSQTSYVMV